MIFAADRMNWSCFVDCDVSTIVVDVSNVLLERVATDVAVRTMSVISGNVIVRFAV